uniref:transposase n=1 Tax=Nocardia vaccinii TaxID=1822 RepID=UPI000B2A287D
MSERSSPYPRLSVDAAGTGVVPHARAHPAAAHRREGRTDQGLSKALAPWRKALTTHDHGKIILDLAVAVVVGGDHLCDIAVLRAEPGVFGHVVSDPTVSRTIATLATDAPKVVSALRSARRGARASRQRAR